MLTLYVLNQEHSHTHAAHVCLVCQLCKLNYICLLKATMHTGEKERHFSQIPTCDDRE